MTHNVRAFKAILRKRGYTCRPGKGSHSIWTHPARPHCRIVLAGSDRDDVKPYQEARLRRLQRRPRPQRRMRPHGGKRGRKR